MINLTEYQAQIKQFYTAEVAADLLTYSREALVAEVGEVVGLRAKRRRGDAGLQDDAAYREAVVLEMGDMLFSLASIFTEEELLFEIRSTWDYTAVPLGAITERLHQLVTGSAGVYTSWTAEELISFLWQYAIGDRLHHDTLEEIARANIGKLTDRQAAGTIRGSSDDR
jgi:hypothetical protein